jgi:bifunctional NMN adenylyltransferase/nudix hydrolase
MLRVHTAVLIGRFQPFHHGHRALLEHALQSARQVIVVLGSAHQARSPKNPFFWQEREQLIRASLRAEQQAQLHFVPVRDYYDLPRWVQAVQQGVDALVPRGARIGLVGHDKDASSRYLRHFPDWQAIDLPRQGDIDATPLRARYWNLADQPKDQVLADLAPSVPPTTLQWLHRWMDTPAYAGMRAEAQALHAYRQSWAQAPFTPMFVTVDVLALCAGRVLLIQRGHHPGKDLLALPGGFLEPSDTLEQSAQRELQEETGLVLSPDAWRTALQGVEVFDHPSRSQRGRTITHVYVLQLPGQTPPPVAGGDDAAAAHWVPLADLAARESEFFEDHFHVLRRCFARFGGGPDVALA